MDPSQLSDDFREFLACLNEARREYLVVGGHAVAYHGYVRPTRAVDIWIAISPENGERVVQSVTSFFSTALAGLTRRWFLGPANVTRFGAGPNLVELLSKISGVDFAPDYLRRFIAELAGRKVNIMSPADLHSNKRASGRFKDLADLENLPEAQIP